MSKKYIKEVLERFYLTSHVAIQAFQSDGHHIHSFGYNDKLNRMFDFHDIYGKMSAKMANYKSDNFVTIPIPGDIYYTSCFICQKNKHKGIFILGPYSYTKNNSMNIVYKPIWILPDLISLLNSIWGDCQDNPDTKCKIYNLHVKSAINYMDGRYNEEITLSNLAAYLNINKSYFSSIFKKETGKPFTQYLNEVRIEKSKYMLKEDHASMLDIALAVGFNNQNYFNIMFKKYTNSTPLEFKNTCI